MVVNTYMELCRMRALVESEDTIVLDLETMGLQFHIGHAIMGIALSNLSGTKAFYLPIRKYNKASNTVEKKPFYVYGKELVQQLVGKKLVTWNGAFDLPFIKHEFGVNLVPHLHIEGMLLKHCVDEYRPFALKEVAAKLFGHDVKDEQQAMKDSIKDNGGTPKEYYKANEQLLGKYAVQDVVLTGMCVRHYLPLLKKEGLEKFFFEDEVMPVYKEVTIPMEQRGIRLHKDKLLQAQAELQEHLHYYEDKIQEAISPHLEEFRQWYLNKEYKPARTGAFGQAVAAVFGIADQLPRTKSGSISLSSKALMSVQPRCNRTLFLMGRDVLLSKDEIRQVQEYLFEQSGQRYMFNIASKHHLKKLFYEKLGETPLNRTEKGNPQVDDDFITSMHSKYEWCQWLTTYNKLSKLKSTYVDRFIDEAIDWRFYPRFLQHGTISGRYGSNLQQLPRPTGSDDIVGKYTDLVRQFFIADEGSVFIDADYESLEPKVFAHVSGDHRLHNIFKEGLDFYSEIAIRTEGIKNVSSSKSADNYLGKVDKARRQKAKAYSLGIPYGMSGYKLSFELGVPVETAEQLVADYLNAFPDLKKWMYETKKSVVRTGKVQSLAGRIRHMPEAVGLWKKYGPDLLDTLAIWKNFKKDLGDEVLYRRMMEKHRLLKNYINNGNNFQIQSLSASIVNRAALEINRKLKKQDIPGGVVCQVHDQLIVAVPQEHAKFAQQLVQYTMENIMQLDVPLTAPAEIGKDFYEAH